MQTALSKKKVKGRKEGGKKERKKDRQKERIRERKKLRHAQWFSVVQEILELGKIDLE